MLTNHLITTDVSVAIEEREIMKGTTTTLSCVVDAPSTTTEEFDIMWTSHGITWDSKNPTTIDHHSASLGKLEDDAQRKQQVATLEVKPAAVTSDVQYTCAVNSTEYVLENADDKYTLNLGVYG